MYPVRHFEDSRWDPGCSPLAGLFVFLGVGRNRNHQCPTGRRPIIPHGFDLSAEPDFTLKSTTSAVVLVFSDTAFSSSVPASRKSGRQGLRGVLFSTLEIAPVKLKSSLADHLTVEVFPLKKFMDKPDRVVVDLLWRCPKKKTGKRQGDAVRRKRVIVVDPATAEKIGGHRQNRHLRKARGLAISGKSKRLSTKCGLSGRADRDGDYYVSFASVWTLPGRPMPVLFISVHASAARNRQAKCSSVYCSVTRRRKQRSGEAFGHNENLSDINVGAFRAAGETIRPMKYPHYVSNPHDNLSKTFAR